MPHRLVALGLLLCSGACAPEGPAPPRSGQTAEVFDEMSRVALDTAIVATIGRLNDILPLDDRILVADRMTDRVLSFAPDGRFQGAIGRRGEGPGEFRTPLALLEDLDGTILVADASDRLTRLSRALELVEVHRPEVPMIVGGLAMLRDTIVLFQPSGRESGDNFALWDRHVGTIASFDRRSELVLQVPYWSAAWSTLWARAGAHLFVADNMVYPIRRYTLDRQLIDSVGTAPPSWKQARRPELGEFARTDATGRQAGAEEWLRSFTRIDGLFALDDEWLLVTHRDRVNQYETEDVLRADLYALGPEFRKVWEDVPLPGPVLRGGACAWVIVAVPPEPWTLACWIARAPA
ncbi:MAG TPA: 6-bladed beta-propeller [Longimicrobiales bacterium]|nr:6-bladed beta-propeller [Longimicrobiales bacterium]